MRKIILAASILIGLFLVWGCGPTYPEGNNGNTYPIPEISESSLNYNTVREELHCELSINYDSSITDLRANLILEGFTLASVQTTLNDSGLAGDALPGDGVFSKNIQLDRIDSLTGNIEVQYDIYENGMSVKTYYDSLEVIANTAPFIIEITMPDTIVRPTAGRDGSVTYKTLLISLTVDDPNGVFDVTNAYFQVKSNSTGLWGTDFDMYDTGEEGDVSAGDGVFSRGLQISSSNSAATNYFRFRVKDTAANFSDWSLDSVVVR